MLRRYGARATKSLPAADRRPMCRSQSDDRGDMLVGRGVPIRGTREPAMSRMIEFAEAGGPDVLHYVETEVRAPGAQEVRIAVRAIGINRAEAMWRNDDYIEKVRFPAGLGYEAAGMVDAVGAEVTGFAVGDAVNVIPSFLDERLHHLRRIRHPAGLRRGAAADRALLHRSGVGLDDVRDGVRGAHRGCEGDEGRFRPHPRRVQQRRPRGHPACQLCRCHADRIDPNLRQAAAPSGCRCGACDRHRGDRPRRGGDAQSPMAAACASPSIRWADRRCAS